MAIQQYCQKQLWLHGSIVNLILKGRLIEENFAGYVRLNLIVLGARPEVC